MKTFSRRNFLVRAAGLAGAALAAESRSYERTAIAGQATQVGGTGFFTITRRRGRWWLISPEGERFFSIGLNHIDSAKVRYETHPETFPERDSGDPTPSDNAERSQEAAHMRALLATLPPKQKAVVVLKTWEERTFREIASILGIAEGTAKAHYFFALRGMRKRMEAADEP